VNSTGAVIMDINFHGISFLTDKRACHAILLYRSIPNVSDSEFRQTSPEAFGNFEILNDEDARVESGKGEGSDCDRFVLISQTPDPVMRHSRLHMRCISHRNPETFPDYDICHDDTPSL
jgi:hypothetical protein